MDSEADLTTAANLPETDVAHGTHSHQTAVKEDILWTVKQT